MRKMVECPITEATALKFPDGMIIGKKDWNFEMLYFCKRTPVKWVLEDDPENKIGENFEPDPGQ
jgi:hypothetical protein